jgi:hypothetical protein
MLKFFSLLIFTVMTAGDGLGQDLVHPETVRQCLKNKKAYALSVRTSSNPYYLRGDFDGDTKPDYALEVRSKKGGTGVLVCTGKGTVSLLGSGIGGERFSDMPDDNFLAPYWEVYTKEEVVELGKWIHNVPDPVSPKGESIALIWEDGISLIYWNGSKFKWAGSKE